MKRTIVLLPVALLALSGCTPVDTGFGEALRWDMAQQTVNPEPLPPEEGAPMEGGDGAKASRAIDRYQRDNVKQPANIRTGGAAGSSGGSN